ncbi:MAG TPA: hypothetical protein VMV05_04165 [bacterium]|nr:hypothetical protein [bacterium]
MHGGGVKKSPIPLFTEVNGQHPQDSLVPSRPKGEILQTVKPQENPKDEDQKAVSPIKFDLKFREKIFFGRGFWNGEKRKPQRRREDSNCQNYQFELNGEIGIRQKQV